MCMYQREIFHGHTGMKNLFCWMLLNVLSSFSLFAYDKVILTTPLQSPSNDLPSNEPIPNFDFHPFDHAHFDECHRIQLKTYDATKVLCAGKSNHQLFNDFSHYAIPIICTL